MGGRRVARGAGIDHRDPASGPAQDERSTEAGRPASDHHDVVGACVAAGPGEESEVVGELGRSARGSIRRLARIRRRGISAVIWTTWRSRRVDEGGARLVMVTPCASGLTRR